MLLYLDTSAFVPLLVDEPSSETCERAWTAATVVASSVLLVAECLAALSMAHRTGRLGTRQLNAAMANAEQLLEQVSLITATPALARRAGALALGHGLRGYDAVHLATALALTGDQASGAPTAEFALASGDQDLLTAASTAGLTVVATTPQ